ncbi:MAG: CBS domain-containing protein [Ilumatobacteraceae bacterium]|nr:CBS domain-containing protein [Ilumatobacteraceae bacterium]
MRKTIVIVTHDIDEAIKLADRVAILNVGGVLEQYDTPDALLSAPATEFVASFLGRERGLRRLALRTVRDVEPSAGPAVAPAASPTEAIGTMDRFGTRWVAVVEGDRLLGWVGREQVAGLTSPSIAALATTPFVSRVSPDTPLREALDVIVNARSRMAVVVDGETYLGVITIDEVAGGLES